MYIMYLRKSRADNPDETVEEVLAKHEAILQDFCRRELGHEIPEADIYREVVSGESIDDRVEIKKVLARMEGPEVQGIIVVEPQRLSRGDLIDCGRLMNLLQYTHTLVITPIMTYNMNNKMERRFFQDELLRGRDYLEYTKEILMRGKLASINRGCYLPSRPPYGYDRTKIGKDNTLIPNKDADTVRLIFEMFVNGSTTWEITKKLQELGIKSPSGGDEWKHATLDKMLKNKHYIGKIEYQKIKTTVSVVDGEKVAKRIRQAEGDYLVTEGKHPAIIDKEIFEKAQGIISKRPPVKNKVDLCNAFAGVMYCARCGRVMVYKDKNGINKYLCCKTKGCSKSIRYEIMLDTVIQTLEQAELPDLVARKNNGEGNAIELQKKLIKNLEKDLIDMRAQEETQYELLETRQYTQELFNRRNKILRDKMKETEEKIREAKLSLPDAINYDEKIISLKDAIQALKDDDVPVVKKNDLLKAIIERIEVQSDPLQGYGKYDFELKVKLLL